MTMENGTAYVMPFPSIGIRTMVQYIRDAQTDDAIGFWGDQPGKAAVDLPEASLCPVR